MAIHISFILYRKIKISSILQHYKSGQTYSQLVEQSRIPALVNIHIHSWELGWLNVLGGLARAALNSGQQPKTTIIPRFTISSNGKKSFCHQTFCAGAQIIYMVALCDLTYMYMCVCTNSIPWNICDDEMEKTMITTPFIMGFFSMLSGVTVWHITQCGTI